VAGLLKGVRVVETGVLMTVDNLGRLLGDEGADVVKVESPLGGDYLRDIMTRFAPGQSAFHLTLNRNKRSVAIDARASEGQALLHRLVATADVFITGNVGTTNEKLGLDHQSLRQVNPSIVYCQATGFGASGPYAEVPTHGQMMDELGGATPPLEVVDGLVRTVPGEGATPTQGVVIGPLHAAFGVAAALVRRATTGEGCYLDVSCADAVLAAGWVDALPALNPGAVDPEGPDTGPVDSAKYQHYATKDGKFVLFCGIEAKFWDNFCRAVGRDDLVATHRRDLVVDFGQDEHALRRTLQDVFATRTLAEWMNLAVEHDIALGPALRFPDVRDDPHLRAREMLVAEHHPVVGTFETVGNPLRVPGEPFEIRHSAPTLGEHTEEVLAELGVDQAERDRLRASGVVR
jgi:crotonobetainyl-CoA:carnitine CoA-transferase CaiB-like acyl-CoA transferase